jgi:Ca2+-binding RTX toxin-like protein
MRLRSILIGGLFLVFVFSVPASTAAGPVFETGDLIVSQGYWAGEDITWHRSDGTLVKPLDAGFQDASGAEFDPSGRLWVVSFGGNKAVTFDSEGNLLGTIVDEIHDPSTPGGHPTDLAFDAAGNAYIGAFELEGPITKWDTSGAPLGVIEEVEADHLDLAADQCTLFFQHANNGPTYYKNACTDTPTDWPFPIVPYDYGTRDPSESFGMRILPDGSLLLNLPSNTGLRGATVRVQLDGTPVQYYDTPDCDSGTWLGVTINEDATSFWTSCSSPDGLVPTEFDIQTGSVVRTLPIKGMVQAVYGGFRAAQGRALCGDAVATIVGTNGPDRLVGTNGPDVIAALDGDDVVFGRGGDDVICGGLGDDKIEAGTGNDFVFGDVSFGAPGGGRDLIRGGSGDDEIFGWEGADALYGDAGADLIAGQQGADFIRAGHGEDTAIGGPGNDTIHGDNNADVLYGAFGDDSIFGGDGADYLNGDLPFPPDMSDTGEPGSFEDPNPNSDSCNGGAGTDAAEWCETTSNIP